MTQNSPAEMTKVASAENNPSKTIPQKAADTFTDPEKELINPIKKILENIV